MRAETQNIVEAIRKSLKLLGQRMDWETAPHRLEEFNAMIEDGDLWSDPARAQKLMRDRQMLMDKVETYRKIDRDLTDNDTFGANGGSIQRCGSSPPTGYSVNNTDCCNTEPLANPNATTFRTSARTGCGGYDYDCDGMDERRYTAVNACQSSGTCFINRACGNEYDGWSGASIPNCGASANYLSNCVAVPFCGGDICDSTSASRTQSCR